MCLALSRGYQRLSNSLCKQTQTFLTCGSDKLILAYKKLIQQNLKVVPQLTEGGREGGVF